MWQKLASGRERQYFARQCKQDTGMCFFSYCSSHELCRSACSTSSIIEPANVRCAQGVDLTHEHTFPLFFTQGVLQHIHIHTLEYVTWRVHRQNHGFELMNGIFHSRPCRLLLWRADCIFRLIQTTRGCWLRLICIWLYDFTGQLCCNHMYGEKSWKRHFQWTIDLSISVFKINRL